MHVDALKNMLRLMEFVGNAHHIQNLTVIEQNVSVNRIIHGILPQGNVITSSALPIQNLYVMVIHSNASASMGIYFMMVHASRILSVMKIKYILATVNVKFHM